jgi:hypothetical protein
MNYILIDKDKIKERIETLEFTNRQIIVGSKLDNKIAILELQELLNSPSITGEELAVGFANWIADQDLFFNVTEGWECDSYYYTSKELLDLYLSTLNKK